MNFAQISCTKFTYEFAHKFMNTKENFVCEISEIRARILNEERNLCTNLNKPTRLHQDRHSKTSYFDNYMVNLKSKSIKLILKFSTYNYVY